MGGRPLSSHAAQHVWTQVLTMARAGPAHGEVPVGVITACVAGGRRRPGLGPAERSGEAREPSARGLLCPPPAGRAT